MPKLASAALIAAAVTLAVTALAFIVTPDRFASYSVAEQTDTATRATITPTEMTERAPRNLPIEQYDAY